MRAKYQLEHNRLLWDKMDEIGRRKFIKSVDLDKTKTIEQELSENLSKKDEKYKIDVYCNHLNLDKKTYINKISGGQKRRVGLIKSLIDESDILLLDEPTNHLDMECIEWLENHLLLLKKVILLMLKLFFKS